MTADTITAADIRINARWLIPIEPADVVLEHQAVLVQGDRIAAIVSQDEADARFRAKEVIDLPSHVVLPGLINMHGHAAMSLFRGLADDLPLMARRGRGCQRSVHCRWHPACHGGNAAHRHHHVFRYVLLPGNRCPACA